MPLTTAERNKKRRDKKKQERLLQKKLSDEDKNNFDNTNKGDVNNEGEGDDIEYEYVVEPIVIPSSFLSSTGNTIDGNKVDANGNSAMTMATTTAMTVNDSMENAADATSSSAPPQDGGLADVLRRFQDRAGVLVSDDENGSGDDAAAISKKNANGDNNDNNNNSDDNEVSWSDIDDDGDNSEYGSGDEDGNDGAISKRRMREINRPTVAELKKRVERADLVEAHDVTAPDPDFLLYLKSIAGSVPVPRHWGRKRKYLQGKRGIEKPPFQLPDFIAKTGITEIRSAVAEDENTATARQKNRGRVAPKMGALDVDYRVLHDAFFKYQNRRIVRERLSRHGDLYYEGREFEAGGGGVGLVGGGGGGSGSGGNSSTRTIGGRMSERLMAALGMVGLHSPPPWLVNQQRYGPPPSHPNLCIGGLNAPIPAGCSYGYHLGGWGKPPVDVAGRPLYGGDPFAPPGSGTGGGDDDDDANLSGAVAVVSSDGRMVGRARWGALPEYDAEYNSGGEGEEGDEEDSDDEDEESGEEMEEEEGEEGEEDELEEGVEKVGIKGADNPPVTPSDGIDSVVPTGSSLDLRKQAGDETPAPVGVNVVSSSNATAARLYTVLQQKKIDGEGQEGAMFRSDVAYVVPTAGEGAGTNADENIGAAGGDGLAKQPPGMGLEGAESVLSKAPGGEGARRKRRDDEDDKDLGKRFKF